MNGTEPACRARFGHGGGSRATFGHDEGSRARPGRSETQICPDPARERTRHSKLARLRHRGLGLRANGTAIAAVAPGIDKILVAIHAHNLAMVGTMPAHDLSRAEFEIVDVEHEGLAPQHRGITSISGVHLALLKSARDADAPDIGKVGALAKLQLHGFPQRDSQSAIVRPTNCLD